MAESDEQAEQAGNKEPTPPEQDAPPNEQIVEDSPKVERGKAAASAVKNGKTAVAPPEPVDQFAIYHRTGDGWTLKRTFATQGGAVSSFNSAKLADEIDESRIVSRVDGMPFTDTAYPHEIDAFVRIAQMSRR